VNLPPPRTIAYNGLAKTPPMGWNSWNKFRTKIDDKTIREVADAIVASGMKDAGYTYINTDDG
jgi:alpha-galactosidase